MEWNGYHTHPFGGHAYLFYLDIGAKALNIAEYAAQGVISINMVSLHEERTANG